MAIGLPSTFSASGAVYADDVAALRDDALKRDPHVLERPLEFANVSGKPREITRVSIGSLRVPGTEVTSDRAFIEGVGLEHISKARSTRLLFNSSCPGAPWHFLSSPQSSIESHPFRG
jgi:hypothetical protein